jgi:hypothetical protein
MDEKALCGMEVLRLNMDRFSFNFLKTALDESKFWCLNNATNR